MNSTLEAPEDICNEETWPEESWTGAAREPSPCPDTVGIASAHVEIYDQVYHLRGVEPGYIAELAAMVDQKMRAVSERGNTVDSLRVAVLAALNIADELTSLRQSYNDLAGAQRSSQSTLRNRADCLSGMLDEVLSDRRAG